MFCGAEGLSMSQVDFDEDEFLLCPSSTDCGVDVNLETGLETNHQNYNQAAKNNHCTSSSASLTLQRKLL